MIFCVASTSFGMYIKAWNGNLNEFHHRFWATHCLFQRLVYQIYVGNFCLPQTVSSILREDCYFKGTFSRWVWNIYELKCSNHSITDFTQLHKNITRKRKFKPFIYRDSNDNPQCFINRTEQTSKFDNKADFRLFLV